MGYHTTTLLDTTQEKTGDAFPVPRRDRLLFAVDLAGGGICEIQARQSGGPWRTLKTFAAPGELNVENFGWHEVRAAARESAGARITVTMSGR